MVIGYFDLENVGNTEDFRMELPYAKLVTGYLESNMARKKKVPTFGTSTSASSYRK